MRFICLILLSFICSIAEGGVNVYNPDDAVTFCKISLDDAAMDKLIKDNNGLADLPAVEKSLAEGKYIPVLTAIWSERDLNKKIKWLREKEGELHAPLMYELALAELEMNPSLETFTKVTCPLFKAATWRVEQDAECTDDLSVKNAVNVMFLTYMDGILKLAEKKLSPQELSLIENNLEYWVSATREKVIEVMKRSQTASLPDPTWVAHYGMGKNTGDMKMLPEDQWQGIRFDFAKRIIE